MSCPFYGFHLAPSTHVLIDSAGNECPLYSDAHQLSPCQMERAADHPDIALCPLDDLRIHLAAHIRANYSLIRRTGPALTFADWERNHPQEHRP